MAVARNIRRKCKNVQARAFSKGAAFRKVMSLNHLVILGCLQRPHLQIAILSAVCSSAIPHVMRCARLNQSVGSFKIS